MSNFVERETPEFPEKTHTFSPGREGKQHSHHIWHCSGWSRPSHKGGGRTSLRASFWSKNMGEARPGPPGPLPWIRYCIEFVVGSCLVPIRLYLERKRITEREKRDRRSGKGDGRRKTKWKDDWQILTQKVVRRLEKFCYLSQLFSLSPFAFPLIAFLSLLGTLRSNEWPSVTNINFLLTTSADRKE